MTGAGVDIRGLSVRYGPVVAVDDISFSIRAGEVFGLLGVNGAGKTTTLECITTLRRPTAGTILIDGIDVADRPADVKRIVGAQLQQTSLHEKITPREALRFFRAFFDAGPGVEELVDRFGLAEKADARFDTLSVGQRQRVGLALAFVNDPRLLVLDEPTAGLDPVSRRQLHDAIRAAKSDGRTVLLSTHHIDEAEQLCDRVGIIAAGKLVAVGTVAELVDRAGGRSGLSIRTDRADEVIQSDDLTRSMIDLARRIEATGERLIDVRVVRPSLEEAFLKLTGAEGNDAKSS